MNLKLLFTLTGLFVLNDIAQAQSLPPVREPIQVPSDVFDGIAREAERNGIMHDARYDALKLFHGLNRDTDEHKAMGQEEAFQAESEFIKKHLPEVKDIEDAYNNMAEINFFDFSQTLDRLSIDEVVDIIVRLDKMIQDRAGYGTMDMDLYGELSDAYKYYPNDMAAGYRFAVQIKLLKKLIDRGEEYDANEILAEKDTKVLVEKYVDLR